MEAVIEQLKGQIQELQQQLDMRTNATHDDPHKLKPIDMKDIEKADKYDNNVSKFVTWYDRFRDLVENRHPNWKYVFNAIESAGENKIMDTKESCSLLNVSDRKSRDQSLGHMCQLKSYLRTCTVGELHARVSQTKSDGIMELMRDVIYKGRNRNPNRLIDMKAKALSPPRAMKVSGICPSSR